MYTLLLRPNLNTSSISATLRKHNFVGILATTLSNAVSFGRRRSGPTESRLQSAVPGQDARSTDVAMEDVPSSASSSVTETGSPVVRIVRRDGRFALAMRPDQGSAHKLQELLTAIFRAVQLLEGQIAKTSRKLTDSHKRRKLEVTTAVLRGTPEAAASILESYLKLRHVLLLNESWTDSISLGQECCLSIWRSSSYGFSDFEKVRYSS